MFYLFIYLLFFNFIFVFCAGGIANYRGSDDAHPLMGDRICNLLALSDAATTESIVGRSSSQRGTPIDYCTVADTIFMYLNECDCN